MAEQLSQLGGVTVGRGEGNDTIGAMCTGSFTGKIWMFCFVVVLVAGVFLCVEDVQL